MLSRHQDRDRTPARRAHSGLHSQLRRIGWAALDLLAPPTCAGCGRVGSSWCAACFARTKLLSGDLCAVCGGAAPAGACPHCADYPSNFDAARSYAVYEDPFKRILLRFKYEHDLALGDLVARMTSQTVLAFTGEVDGLVPVPLGPDRFKSRGYNQVDLFARPLARYIGVPYLPDGLQRKRETRSQVGLTGDQRRQNLSGAFVASPEVVEGRSVLLVDDVFTTGSTGNACARALRAAGAQAVFLFTLARAVGSEEVVTDIV